MGGLVRTPKPVDKKPETKKDISSKKNIEIKKVSKPKPKPEVDEDEVPDDEGIDFNKVEIKKNTSSEKFLRETIGITGNGKIATEFRRICKTSGINMSYELCKMINKFNTEKGG